MTWPPERVALLSLKLRSFLCVPLIGWDGKRLGVIQLDCQRAGQAFRAEDLELLTAIGLQVAVVLENVALHAERLREERLRQELKELQEQLRIPLLLITHDDEDLRVLAHDVIHLQGGRVVAAADAEESVDVA